MTDPGNLLDRQIQLGNFLVAGWPALAIPPMPRVSAAAAVGNATQENACRSVTTGELDHGSNGLFQWRLDRLTNMQAFAVKNFGAWGAIEPQAAFFSFECKGDYPALWADLVAGSKSLATLTANICSLYERPAAASAALDARIKYATDFLAVWPVAVPAVSAVPVAMPAQTVSPPIAAMPPPRPTAPPALAPAPAAVTLSEGQLAVVQALASAILIATKPDIILALATAIVSEVET